MSSTDFTAFTFGRIVSPYTESHAFSIVFHWIGRKRRNVSCLLEELKGTTSLLNWVVNHFNNGCGRRLHRSTKMAKGLIWATAEDLARNRGRVLSLYRQLLRSLNSPDLPLNLAARLAKKAEVRAIFIVASEERSLHSIEDLFDAADYSLSLLRKGEIPKYIQ
ncbi:hypothetical protein Vadar_033150 [Vaccinium darrowii]|uniref:Uncharacterized protein n=1 Tax=Vaccinium darrowii TaxID=229202 RepID=A0ACB7ZG36_9ERIC|nr:hypothetical protein Vadar_033150 [Vaccinium darrowii]